MVAWLQLPLPAADRRRRPPPARIGYYLGHPGGYEHYGLFVVHNQLPKWVRTLSLFVVRCLICLFVACVTCLWLGCVMCLFLVCVLFLFLVCVMCLCTLASLRSAGARFARCGRFAAAAAASRPQAITPNIIVFIVRGLTFVNVSALDYIFLLLVCSKPE